ncbi:putative membrane protein [Chitinivorax tropicus]|uniref:Putative membrane protein n=1 Tax=Chitinivorax tropicus TaxID=714531 RepID=A0A840MVJ9_9PROT|nr:DUF2238 domain-containing protein [Chitinivorax tropicus]MBB5020373.1 putative membrane protein [Chitinivorax tropicus]
MNYIPNKKTSVLLMAAVFVLTWIMPKWPVEQALHSSLTVVGFFLLWRYVAKYDMDDLDFLLIALFISVHSIAARWLYSNVPYERWLVDCCGISLNHLFASDRNHFDRLVHFLYGFCFMVPIMSHVIKQRQSNQRVAFYVGLSAIMITSLWYEWFEWLIAVLLSPADAESYNGQQGDIWDAHKDMLLATLGGLLSGLGYRKLKQSPVPANG